MRRARVARKQWVCFTCGDKIKVGHIYEDCAMGTGSYQGWHNLKWYNVRRCAECANELPNKHSLGRRPNTQQKEGWGK